MLTMMPLSFLSTSSKVSCSAGSSGSSPDRRWPRRRVGRLGRPKEDAVGQQILNGLGGGGHIGALGHDGDAVGHQGLGILLVQLILVAQGQGDVAGDLPHVAAVVAVGGAGDALGVLADAGALHFLDLLHHVQVDAVGVVDIALGVGHGDDLGAQLHGLLGGVNGDVAGAGDDHGLALQALALHALEHLLDEVQQAVAGGLGPGQAAAEGQALAGEDAVKLFLRNLYWPNR